MSIQVQGISSWRADEFFSHYLYTGKCFTGFGSKLTLIYNNLEPRPVEKLKYREILPLSELGSE